MSNKDFIDYLNSYGATAGNDCAYDEHVVSKIKNLTPITLENPFFEEIKNKAKSSDSCVFLIVGCAGDGKTYLLRKVFNDLGLDKSLWRGNKIVCKQNDQEYVFIRDMSGVVENSDENKEIIDLLLQIYEGKKQNCLLFIAANDGQILEKIKHYKAEFSGTENNDIATELLSYLEFVFVEHNKNEDNPRLFIRDLRYICTDKYIEDAINEVISNPAWNNCESCDHHDRCPILKNKAYLEQEDFKKQLISLITISKADGYHLTTRNLLMLLSNIILGVTVGQNKNPVLSCNRVGRLLKEGKLESSNTIDNVFGYNLGKIRKQKPFFDYLDSLKIGDESSKKIDAFIVDGSDINKKVYNQFIEDDSYKHFEKALSEYLHYSAYESDPKKIVEDYEQALCQQRRRLFFSPSLGSDALNLWQMSIYKHAEDYFSLLNYVRGNHDKSITDVDIRTITKKIILGMNRFYTGLLAQNNKPSIDLYITSSGSFNKSKVNNLHPFKFKYKAVSPDAEVKTNDIPYVYLSKSNGEEVYPAICVQKADRKELCVLSPTIFEFLISIAEGTVPTTFAYQCLEKVFNFKLKILSMIEQCETEEELNTISLLSLNDEGELGEKFISIGDY